jgi:hypothetical protein
LLQAPTQQLFSGSLLALRLADQEKILWKLALIRWLRFGTERHVSLGAEYLADACWPTQLHLIDYETPIDVVQPGFFFRDRGRPEVAGFLFAPNTFHPAARVAFDLFGKQYMVTLTSVRPYPGRCPTTSSIRSALSTRSDQCVITNKQRVGIGTIPPAERMRLRHWPELQRQQVQQHACFALSNAFLARPSSRPSCRPSSRPFSMNRSANRVISATSSGYRWR